jgi:hypothetical protein
MKRSFINLEDDPTSGTAPHFGAFVAYRDLASKQRARKLLTRIASALCSGDSANFPSTFWNFETPSSTLFLSAVECARHADIVIVAAPEEKEVSPALRAWIESWLALKAGIPSALVAVLQRRGPNTDLPQTIELYLQQIAKRGGFALFAEGRRQPLPSAANDHAFQNLFPALAQS